MHLQEGNKESFITRSLPPRVAILRAKFVMEFRYTSNTHAGDKAYGMYGMPVLVELANALGNNMFDA